MKKVCSRAIAAAVVAGMAGAAVPAAAGGDDYGEADYVYSFWEGMYGGVHLGHGDAGGDLDGFVGGVQLGKNWQNGKVVYGWEADVTLSGMEVDGFACAPGVGCAPGELSIDWMATARGRLGYLFQPNLIGYATAGLGMYSVSVDSPVFSDDETETDFVFGFGGEYKYNDMTSVRAEYLNIDDIDILRAGLNFKLNGY